LQGEREELRLTSSGKLEADALLNRLADLGIEGAAKYQSSNYIGVLEENLIASLSNSRDCKIEVFKDLIDKLTGSNKTTTNPSN
jgi:hypothetical protein